MLHIFYLHITKRLNTKRNFLHEKSGHIWFELKTFRTQIRFTVFKTTKVQVQEKH